MVDCIKIDDLLALHGLHCRKLTREPLAHLVEALLAEMMICKMALASKAKTSDIPGAISCRYRVCVISYEVNSGATVMKSLERQSRQESAITTPPPQLVLPARPDRPVSSTHPATSFNSLNNNGVAFLQDSGRCREEGALKLCRFAAQSPASPELDPTLSYPQNILPEL